MPLHSISHYSEATGIDRRTIKKRLSNLEGQPGDKNAILYESIQALPLLYKTIDDGKLSAKKEHTLLTRARRKKVRVERTMLEGGLVPASVVVAFCRDMRTVVRKKLLSLPGHFRSNHPNIDSELISEVEELIIDALTNMPDDGIPLPLKDRMSIYLSRMEQEKTQPEGGL